MIKSIPDTKDRYLVTSEGSIYHLRKDGCYEPIKVWVNEHGYCVVTINAKKKRVHRIVAQTFIDNPKNMPQVNHKDGDKQNNSVENLEWCSQMLNMNHASTHELTPGSSRHRPVTAEKDGIVTHYPTVAACSRAIGADSKSIRDVLNGRYRKTCKGYKVYETKAVEQMQIEY